MKDDRERDYKGRLKRARPTHYVAVIVSHDGSMTTRKIACGLSDDAAMVATEVKEHVTCKRCQRSPYFDPALYRGKW
jgi:hypothetical protein